MDEGVWASSRKNGIQVLIGADANFDFASTVAVWIRVPAPR